LRSTLADRGIQGRWVPPIAYHVTLGFLGWVRPELVVALEDVLTPVMAGARPFELSTGGLGGFPDGARARGLWAGVTACHQVLGDLAGRCAAVTSGLGLEVDPRPYRPHVTLARLTSASDLGWLLAGGAEQVRSISRVTAVDLLDASVISKESGYGVIASWSLE